MYGYTKVISMTLSFAYKRDKLGNIEEHKAR